MSEPSSVVEGFLINLPQHLIDKESKIPCSKLCGVCGGGKKAPLCETSIFEFKRSKFFEILTRDRRMFLASRFEFDLHSVLYLEFMCMYRILSGKNPMISEPKFSTSFKQFLVGNPRIIFERLNLRFCFPNRALCDLLCETQLNGVGCILTQQQWQIIFPELKPSFPILRTFLLPRFYAKTIALNCLITRLIPHSALNLKVFQTLRFKLAKRILKFRNIF
jgi:hypothetical protein